MPSTRTFASRQARLLLIVGACFGCAEGVPIEPGDVVILPQLPDLDGGARDASTTPVQTVPNPAPGASAPAPSPAPIPPAAAAVVAPDTDAGPATDAGG